MEYVYHRVPKDMRGGTLYPLNQLKEIDPELYAHHVKKYEGREKVLEQVIPTLNCLWNDVLHFTAVTPADITLHLHNAGFDYPPMLWYKVPVSMLQKEMVTVFRYHSNKGASQADEYEPLDPESMERYRVVPPETIAYYETMKKEGERPLLFYRVPHILYKGTLDIATLEIISA